MTGNSWKDYSAYKNFYRAECIGARCEQRNSGLLRDLEAELEIENFEITSNSPSEETVAIFDHFRKK